MVFKKFNKIDLLDVNFHKYLLIIWGVLLYSNVLLFYGISKYVPNNFTSINLLLLKFYTIVLLIFLIVVSLASIIRYQKNQKKINEIRLILSILNNREKSILREFFIRARQVQKMPNNDKSVKYLTSRGILINVSKDIEISSYGSINQYKISELIVDFISEELLGYHEENFMSFDFLRIEKARPSWAGKF